MKRMNIYIKPSIKIIKVETLKILASSPAWSGTPNNIYSSGEPLSKQHNSDFGMWDWDNNELWQEKQSSEYTDMEY